MRLLKLALPAAMLGIFLFAGGKTNTSWAEAQAAITGSDAIAARDTETPLEDVALTNRCIEGGKEKIYCLCMTKIFKNEMSLREYRGAVALYLRQDLQPILAYDDYTVAEINSIATLSQELASEDMFRTRCDEAETYFAATTES